MKKKKKTKKTAKKKTAKRRSGAKRAVRRTAPRSRAKARGRKAAGRRRTKPAPTSRRAAKTARTGARPARPVTDRPPRERRPGPESGGQAGDTEGLPGAAIADSESVKGLVEEGQPFEAGIVSGVEEAGDADKGGVRTRQVPEDDVPQEYLDKD